jgi:hypothetical protein
MKAQRVAARRSGQGGLAVEEHDAVPRLRRAALGRFVAFLIMLETPAETLGRQYALQKFQVAFAVLGPDRCTANTFNSSNKSVTPASRV